LADFFDARADFICSQAESSEEFIGEWAESRGIRDQLFLATKVLASEVEAELD